VEPISQIEFLCALASFCAILEILVVTVVI
jgi:hypothetical protein